MCIIISVIMLILSFNFFNAEEFLLSSSSFLVAIFFIYLMIKNINLVKKERENRNDN